MRRVAALLALLFVTAACGSARPPVSVVSPTPSEVILSPAPTPTPTATPAPSPTATPAPGVSPTPTPAPQPEWLANLRANPQRFVLNRSVALIDMPSGAEVARVDAGVLEVAYETVAGGLGFWMTEYSASRSLPYGMLKDEVQAAVDAPPPPPAPDGPPASLAGKEWTTLPTTRQVVALTFDAGGNDAGVAAVLKALADAGAPATFFLTGRWTEVYPGDARLIASRYPVGNHTYSHPDLTTLGDAAVDDQVTHAAAVIESTCGVDPHPLFRFPYGATDARTLARVHALGYGGIRWTVDTLGWKGASGGQSVSSVRDRVVAGLRPGEIVLMHVGAAEDGTTLDATALPEVISAIRARGYELVAVPDFV
jgi:peptidoglycan/xylan/chitin deacetylase (PgdA/CDA1 family)